MCFSFGTQDVIPISVPCPPYHLTHPCVSSCPTLGNSMPLILLIPSFILSVVNFRPAFYLFLPAVLLFLSSLLSSQTTQASSHCVACPPRNSCINFATIFCGVIIACSMDGFCAAFRFVLLFATKSGALTSFLAHPFAVLHFFCIGSFCVLAFVSSSRCPLFIPSLLSARWQRILMSLCLFLISVFRDPHCSESAAFHITRYCGRFPLCQHRTIRLRHLRLFLCIHQVVYVHNKFLR